VERAAAHCGARDEPLAGQCLRRPARRRRSRGARLAIFGFQDKDAASDLRARKTATLIERHRCSARPNNTRRLQPLRIVDMMTA
jgi:hypothetical protein